MEISGRLGRRTVEALRLEIRRLTKRYNIDIKEITIERPEEMRSA